MHYIILRLDLFTLRIWNVPGLSPTKVQAALRRSCEKNVRREGKALECFAANVDEKNVLMGDSHCQTKIKAGPCPVMKVRFPATGWADQDGAGPTSKEAEGSHWAVAWPLVEHRAFPSGRANLPRSIPTVRLLFCTLWRRVMTKHSPGFSWKHIGIKHAQWTFIGSFHLAASQKGRGSWL